ncbi:MAG TPA: hypothetical protein VGS20_16260 [Candidatus Acidoferrales bacterium]|nr:hypothetical protein [Candidatus Acidoferrales bacterium]
MIAKGYRLRPWKSPYIRWRLETFFGPGAEGLQGWGLAALLWRERGRMLRFVRWAGERRAAQRHGG